MEAATITTRQSSPCEDFKHISYARSGAQMMTIDPFLFSLRVAVRIQQKRNVAKRNGGAVLFFLPVKRWPARG